MLPYRIGHIEFLLYHPDSIIVINFISRIILVDLSLIGPFQGSIL